MRTLGNNGPSVSDMGLGCMGMSTCTAPRMSSWNDYAGSPCRKTQQWLK